MANDEHLYAFVTDELRRSGPIPGLWAKAFAEAEGVEHRAQALYLRYRVEQLAYAEAELLRSRQAENLATHVAEREREEAERRERAKAEGFTPIHGILLGLVFLFVVLFVVRAL